MKLTVLTHDKTYEGGTDKLLSYCNKNNIDLNSNEVLYLSVDRKILVSKKEIETYEIMNKLIGLKINRKIVEESFDCSDPFRWEDWEKGNEITCGYEQLISIIFFILLNEDKKILIIDHIEQNLHIAVALHLIKTISNNFNFSNFIFTAYQDYILEKYPIYKGE